MRVCLSRRMYKREKKYWTGFEGSENVLIGADLSSIFGRVGGSQQNMDPDVL